MRVLIQRVRKAFVTIKDQQTAAIGQGLLILVGIEEPDTETDVEWLVHKIINMRLFDDEQGIMNKSVTDIQGELLVVSQFTLMASIKKGNRPSYIRAARPEQAIPLYGKFCALLQTESGRPVFTGIFGADMQVMLINDGPVTIWADSKNKE